MALIVSECSLLRIVSRSSRSGLSSRYARWPGSLDAYEPDTGILSENAKFTHCGKRSLDNDTKEES